MPGIVGLISKNNGMKLFNEMIESLNHNNYKIEKYSKNNVHLGRVHLGYVNVLAQPFFSKDKRFWLVMIGEIYSYGNIENQFYLVYKKYYIFSFDWLSIRSYNIYFDSVKIKYE